MARHPRSSTDPWGKPPRRRAAQRKARAAVRGRRRHSYRASQPASGRGLASGRPGLPLTSGGPSLGSLLPGWRRLAGTGLAAALLATLAFLFASEDFYVESAEITGATYSSLDEIYQASGVHDFSLFWVDAAEAEQRIEQLPFVKHARVSPLLPDKVHIDVLERQPALVWQVDGRAFWVDAEGVILPLAGPGPSLPVLIDLDGSSQDGQESVNPQLVAAVLELSAQLPELKQVAWSQDRGLHFVTPDGTLVVLGQDSQLARRVRHLIALKAELASEGKQAREIDLHLDDGYFMKLVP